MANSSNKAKFFQEQGYFVEHNLVPFEFVDTVLREYASQLKDSDQYYFRQSAGRFEKNRKNEFGFVQQSFLDVHEYINHPSFSKAVLEILSHDKILKLLDECTGHETFTLVQSMFFDANTATAAHQDWYYLDSLPSGHLVGIWIALEDIQEDAGRFYIVPQSHEMAIELSHKEKNSNADYLEKVVTVIETRRLKKIAPALSRGDVLIWHSGLIHGSFPTVNPRFSRKSMTAHYLPRHMKFSSRYHQQERNLVTKEYGKISIALIPNDRKVGNWFYRNKMNIKSKLENHSFSKTVLKMVGLRNRN